MTKQDEIAYEDPQRLREDVAHLRDWLSKQPHINSRSDDAFLLLFLRGCKYSLERAKEKIDYFHTMRTALPEFFAVRDVTEPTITGLIKAGIVLPLGRDALGRRVIFSRVSTYDPKISSDLLAKMHFMMAELIVEEDAERVVNGHVLVIDLKGFSTTHVPRFSPTYLKKVIAVYTEGFPVRPKGIHYLNVAPVWESLIQIVRSLLKQKLRERLILHQDMESLYKMVPKEIVPAEYGGKGGTAAEISELWLQKMTAKKDYFRESENLRVDESKRPGKPKTHEDLFGVEGSFRQLTVD